MWPAMDLGNRGVFMKGGVPRTEVVQNGVGSVIHATVG